MCSLLHLELGAQLVLAQSLLMLLVAAHFFCQSPRQFFGSCRRLQCRPSSAKQGGRFWGWRVGCDALV